MQHCHAWNCVLETATIIAFQLIVLLYVRCFITLSVYIIQTQIWLCDYDETKILCKWGAILTTRSIIYFLTRPQTNYKFEIKL